MSKTESVILKITSAIALDGSIHRAGTLVEVSEAEARNLLDRGKAVLATDKTVKPQKPAPAPTEAELQAAAAAAELAAQQERDAHAKARAMKDNEMDEAAFDALSNTKRNALLKAAHEAIAKDLAA